MTSTIAQFSLNNKRGLIGGVWREDTPWNAFIDMDIPDINVKDIVKATSMLEFLAWDPDQKKKNVFSVASLPVSSNFHGIQGSYRGNWTLLSTVGAFLEASDGLVRGIVFDGHLSHSYVRKLLFGQVKSMDMREVSKVPWFKDLEYMALPSCRVPYIPISIALHDKEYFWCLPGV